MGINVWQESLRVMGPAFLVSVAYLDPGNWATAIESGSRFGFEQVWILVLSNLIAILLQTLAVRLGLVSGKHLAQVCRESYPPLVCKLLWMMTEVSIVALDLTMVLGTAIGLNLLFKVPPLPCILLTGLDALVLVLLVPQTGVRRAELFTVGLVASVLACFVVDLFISQPRLSDVVRGLWPVLHRDGVYTAVSLLGANVMPHNFYLHSALVAGEARQGEKRTAALCKYNFLDIACALSLALFVNLAVLMVAAAAFFSAGVQVATLQDAHDLLEKTLNSRLAPMAFGMALLLTGQMSTFTGTIAGQVVLSGFLNVRCSTFVRRLSTRGAAIVPAVVMQVLYGAPGVYKMLVVAQVVLAVQLPFTLIPLIKATSCRHIMGKFASSHLLSGLSWLCCGIIFAANLLMLGDMLLPGQEWGVGKGVPFGAWLEQVTQNAMRSPSRFLLTCAMMVFASTSLALLMWMLVNPVTVKGLVRHPAKARKEDSAADVGEEETMGVVDIELGLGDVSLRRTAAAPAADNAPLTRFESPAAPEPMPLAPTVTEFLSNLPHALAALWKAPGAPAATPFCPPAAPPPPPPPPLLLTHEALAAHSVAGGAGVAGSCGPGWEHLALMGHPYVLQPRSARSDAGGDDGGRFDREARPRAGAEGDADCAVSERSCAVSATMSTQTHASAATTVAGGGKGHALGRASRKQLAGTLLELWKERFDQFGHPVRGAPRNACAVVLQVCRCVEELLAVPGADTVVHPDDNPSPENLPPTRPPSLSGAAPSMVPLSNVTRAHCDVVSALAHCHVAVASALEAALPTAPRGVENAGGADEQALLSHARRAGGARWGAVERGLSAAWPSLRLSEAPRPDNGAPSLRRSNDWSTLSESPTYSPMRPLSPRSSGHLPSSAVAGAASPFPPTRDDARVIGGAVSASAARAEPPGRVPLFARGRPEVLAQIDGGAEADEVSLRLPADPWSPTSLQTLLWPPAGPGAPLGADGARSVTPNAASMATSSTTTAPPGPAVADCLLMSFGVWSMATLLRLASVEPRPDLWGRYVTVLNHLQGALASIAALTHIGADSPTPRSLEVRTASDTWRSSSSGEPGSARLPGRAAPQPPPAAHWQPLGQQQPTRWPSGELPSPSASRGGRGSRDGAAAAAAAAGPSQLFAEILELVGHVEVSVKAKGPPSSTGGAHGPAAAFAKGKENIMSVLKRYRRQLTPSTAPPPRQGAAPHVKQPPMPAAHHSQGHGPAHGGHSWGAQAPPSQPRFVDRRSDQRGSGRGSPWLSHPRPDGGTGRW